VNSSCCSDEGYGEHVHDGGTVHVDGHTSWQDKACDFLTASEFFFTGLGVDRKGSSGGVGGESEYANFSSV
jgi:hypothetical protein